MKLAEQLCTSSARKDRCCCCCADGFRAMLSFGIGSAGASASFRSTSCRTCVRPDPRITGLARSTAMVAELGQNFGAGSAICRTEAFAGLKIIAITLKQLRHGAF